MSYYQAKITIDFFRSQDSEFPERDTVVVLSSEGESREEALDLVLREWMKMDGEDVIRGVLDEGTWNRDGR